VGSFVYPEAGLRLVKSDTIAAGNPSARVLRHPHTGDLYQVGLVQQNRLVVRRAKGDASGEILAERLLAEDLIWDGSIDTAFHLDPVAGALYLTAWRRGAVQGVPADSFLLRLDATSLKQTGQISLGFSGYSSSYLGYSDTDRVVWRLVPGESTLSEIDLQQMTLTGRVLTAASGAVSKVVGVDPDLGLAYILVGDSTPPGRVDMIVVDLKSGLTLREHGLLGGHAYFGHPYFDHARGRLYLLTQGRIHWFELATGMLRSSADLPGNCDPNLYYCSTLAIASSVSDDSLYLLSYGSLNGVDFEQRQPYLVHRLNATTLESDLAWEFPARRNFLGFEPEGDSILFLDELRGRFLAFDLRSLLETDLGAAVHGINGKRDSCLFDNINDRIIYYAGTSESGIFSLDPIKLDITLFPQHVVQSEDELLTYLDPGTGVLHTWRRNVANEAGRTLFGSGAGVARHWTPPWRARSIIFDKTRNLVHVFKYGGDEVVSLDLSDYRVRALRRTSIAESPPPWSQSVALECDEDWAIVNYSLITVPGSVEAATLSQTINLTSMTVAAERVYPVTTLYSPAAMVAEPGRPSALLMGWDSSISRIDASDLDIEASMSLGTTAAWWRPPLVDHEGESIFALGQLGAGSAQGIGRGDLSRFVPAGTAAFEIAFPLGALDASSGILYISDFTSDALHLHHYTYSQKGYLLGQRVTLPEPALLNEIRFHSHRAKGNLRFAIYSDEEPKQLLWESGNVGNSADEGEVAVPISAGAPGRLLLGSGSYWLAWQTDTTASVGSYHQGAAGEGFLLRQPFGAAPAELGAETIQMTDEAWTIYATFSPAPVAEGDAIRMY